MIPIAPLLLACTGPTGTSGIVPADTSTTDPFPPLPAELVVSDAQVHEFEARWIFPSSPIRAGLEAHVRWDGLTTDAYGEVRDPGDYDVAVLLRAGAPRTEIDDLLATDQLDSVITDAWSEPVRGATEVALSELSGFDPAQDLVEDASASLLFALADRDGDRFDIRAGVVIEPSAAEPGSVLTMPDAVSRIEWSGQMNGGALRTQTGYDAYPVDWSAVATDGYGQPFDPARADELFLGRYEDVDEADDLASRLLDLEATATGWWTAPIAGGATSASLSDLDGFGDLEAGIYLLGARCTTCLGPVPLWTAGIEVRDR